MLEAQVEHGLLTMTDVNGGLDVQYDNRRNITSNEVKAALADDPHQTVALNPDVANIQNRLAAVLQDRPEEALTFARRAVLLAPEDAYNLETLAAVDAALKRCDETSSMGTQPGQPRWPQMSAARCPSRR